MGKRRTYDIAIAGDMIDYIGRELCDITIRTNSWQGRFLASEERITKVAGRDLPKRVVELTIDQCEEFLEYIKSTAVTQAKGASYLSSRYQQNVWGAAVRLKRRLTNVVNGAD